MQSLSETVNGGFSLRRFSTRCFHWFSTFNSDCDFYKLLPTPLFLWPATCWKKFCKLRQVKPFNPRDFSIRPLGKRLCFIWKNIASNILDPQTYRWAVVAMHSRQKAFFLGDGAQAWIWYSIWDSTTALCNGMNGFCTQMLCQVSLLSRLPPVFTV